MAGEARQREENSRTSPGLFYVVVVVVVVCFGFFSFCAFHGEKIKVNFWYISGP